MTQLVTLVRHGNVGLVTIDNPPVNALSHAVRVALLEVLTSAARDAEIAALVVACAGRTFVAGADIKEFGRPPLAPDLPDVVEFLDTFEKPVVAALHGTALGGGLELALGCHYRVASPGTKLGLPEVTLGILPGAGGTQRLPRLIGVRAALEMIVGGALIPIAKAHELGIVDAVVEGELGAAAVDFARRVLAAQRPLSRVSARSATLEDPGVFERATTDANQRWRGYLAPFHCIEAVRAAVELPFAQGIERERALFKELMSSSQSRAQRHVFFAEREAAKPAGLASDTSPREIGSVAVLGSDPEAFAVADCFAAARIAVRVLSPSSAPFAELKDVDLVLDATSGDMAEKRELFARLDDACKPLAVLASAAAGVDLDQVAASTRRAGDVIGIHFVPSANGRLLEVSRGRHTSPEVCATALKLGKLLGKVSLLVGASPGGVRQRLFERWSREASRLVESGAQPQHVEQVLFDFGFTRDEIAKTRLATSAARGSNGADGRPSDREILERCVFALVNESARLLDEKVAARPVEIDVICVLGNTFPAYRGGPLFYADEVGPASVLELVNEYRGRVGGDGWEPSTTLQRLAASGGRFYGRP
jgi:3-hydroxyacyl-CoA dehydrogenase